MKIIETRVWINNFRTLLFAQLNCSSCVANGLCICSVIIGFLLQLSKRKNCKYTYPEFKNIHTTLKKQHMKTIYISGNIEGRKPQILGWKWCEGKLLLPYYIPFCRLQPTRGSYLKGRSKSHNFFTCYNPKEAPTSTGYNMFFIKLQHRKGLQSLNYNIKSKLLVTWYTILLSSLLQIFTACPFQLCASSIAAHQLYNVECFTSKRPSFHSTIYILWAWLVSCLYSLQE